ncbi:dihydrolipoamide acetyltransferase family protein [Streptomyces calidiresistens]|uniref:Dihydrolipoamide acetyltransferase component of pyruvate dehydrogenase complex n=1 Tax=Streptomyces calidiresistens TaxID=1485586 RepID=A0A7W3T1S7_9ACTN|nr:dihydrolipoamide acetyltransferase family protein [Streptomyces calidiresistens]MBB0229362.1 2-oxo acid dehydrogenase subunit E2 [Streptomyces calidiresistens]
MPDVGEGLTEAEILSWLVKPGDTVTDGQVVVEVETAKAAVELPIPYDGVVAELLFDEGTTVDVGTAIISVDTDPSAGPAAPPAATGPGAAAGDTGAATAVPVDAGTSPGAPAPGTGDSGAGGPATKETREPVLVGYGVSSGATRRRPRKGAGRAAANGTAPAVETVTEPVAEPVSGPTAGPGPVTADTAVAGRPLAKPPVRKLARDLGIDLTEVTPSGADGIITREDVRAYAERAAAPAGAGRAGGPADTTPAPVAPPGPETGPAEIVGGTEERGRTGAPVVEPQSMELIRERRVPIKGVRKATAKAMVSSAFTAPHVTEFVTVDVTRTMKLVEKLRKDPSLEGLRINPLLMVARAFLVAIRRNPEINASWDEERQEIVLKDYVNLGIAAATPRGLLVPNIKDAGTKTLPELSRALTDLVTTAREGRTSPGDMQGGTVTITNIGVFGVDTGTPILNPGESAILAVGTIKPQPWVHKGKVKPRQVTTLAMSFDHRFVDGELGSKVLADTAAVLEHPQRLISWT